MMNKKKPFPEKLKPITEVIYEILVEVLTMQREMHSKLEVLDKKIGIREYNDRNYKTETIPRD